MSFDIFEFSDRDLDSIAFSVAFNEWLGIDNLQESSFLKLTSKEKQTYRDKLSYYRKFFKHSSSEDFLSHIIMQGKNLK